ncbi:MAG: glycosyltransferase family 2 protein [Bacteroidota bacterium]
MPTYNSAATLDLALESIIHQTFQNVEVLIIDGLSIDNTIEIAKKYQLQFPEIKIVSEADKGIYDAMNKGIGIAKGEWVYFMGSDDSLYETTTLNQVFDKKQIKNLDVIYGNVYAVGFNGVYDGEFTHTKLADKNICHQAIFFRRSIFENTGKFNLKYKALADWDHNIKWFFSSRIKNQYIDQVVANYADGGFSSDGDSSFNKDKNHKLLIKGIGKISLPQLIRICNNAIHQAKEERTKTVVKWILIKICLKIADRMKKVFSRKYRNSTSEKLTG